MRRCGQTSLLLQNQSQPYSVINMIVIHAKFRHSQCSLNVLVLHADLVSLLGTFVNSYNRKDVNDIYTSLG